MDPIVIKDAPTGSDAPVVTPGTPTTPVTPDPNRPAWLPANFKTAEDFAASYKELEKKVGQPPAPVATPAADLADPVKAAAALTAQGIDMKALSDEYAKDGKLSDTTLATLTAKGFTADQVNSYIDGQKAVAEKNSTDVFNSVGGEETFRKIVEFATATMTASEVDAYNKAVNSGDYPTLKLILAGVKTKYDTKMGIEPKITAGEVKDGGNAGSYESHDAYMQDLKNPEYNKNPIFRNGVDAKLARSAWIPKL